MAEDETSASSLWATVLADLRARLKAGEFADRFPSDRELVAHYGVSRHTVREAVRRLEVVDRRPRLGGRVRTTSSVLRRLLDTLTSLGVNVRTTTSPTHNRRSAQIAGLLDCGAGTALTVQTGVLWADGEPLVCLEIWSTALDSLPIDLVATLLDTYAPEPDVKVISQRTVPTVPEPVVCKELGIPNGSVTFCIEARLELDGAQLWQRAFILPNRYPCILQFSAT